MVEFAETDTLGSEELVPAAQYIRMSTEEQSYSPALQKAAIKEFAEQRKFEIIRTYADEGRSGLTYAGRSGLQQLISDVQSGAPGFRAVLVYDVSRWGRFQDTDESAYYEHICRRAGVNVVYCAEQFDNDGSPVSTIVKGLKRAMAGEYSRELGEKVRRAKRRAARQGFYQAGSPGYGLQRVLVDEQGNERGILEEGQRKAVRTDRVIVRPGPAQEVDVVRDIYRMFVDEARTYHGIARTLNARGLTTRAGVPWSMTTVRGILTHEKYTGSLVFGQTRHELKGPIRKLPRDQWIIVEDAFEPIISKEQFESAREVRRRNREKLTEQHVIERLRSVRERYGYLSAKMIDDEPDLPSSQHIAKRFGRLVNAYHLAGYHPHTTRSYFTYKNRHQKIQIELCRAVRKSIQDVGGTLETDKESLTGPFTINGLLSVAIRVVGCVQIRHGPFRWRLLWKDRFKVDLILFARVTPDARGIMDYLLIPRGEFPRHQATTRRRVDGALSPYVCETIEPLLALARNVPVTAAVRQ